ncbi:MAG: hypothetical protein Q7K42_02250 [Candidatus Diapherotrites archaeon]|nr:hypothetical protein [Candidatus Diapherotrites archaeon]
MYPNKVVFFDLETQYLFQDLGMNSSNKDPGKLKLAVAGVLEAENENASFFHEGQEKELLELLRKADLIVGHNLLRFDYVVLQPYFQKDIAKLLHNKTFDTLVELEKLTGVWTSLDDLCRRNIGISKTVDTLKIPKMWRDGQQDEVKDYLLNDLKMTKAIFDHGMQKGKFKYEHKMYGKSFGEKEVNVLWRT